MAIINTNGGFGPTDTVTNTNLNAVADAATFNDPVDEATLELITTGSDSGKLRVKAGGVDTTQIADSAVTKAKIEDVADMKVLGNTSGSAAAPQEVEVIDDDTMATALNTNLATAESIKAYVDSYVDSLPFTESFESAETNIPSVESTISFSHGLSSTPKIIQVFAKCTSAEYNYSVGDEVLIGDYGDAGQMQSAYGNATTVGWGHMYTASTILIKDKDTNNYRIISSPNWKIIIRAYA